MTSVSRSSALALLLLACAAAGAPAQARLPLSLDATVGVGAGVGGPRATSRGGAALDALLGLRLRTLPGGAVSGGLAVGVQGPVVGPDGCLLGDDGGCVPAFPWFGSVGVLGGWESAGGAVRALAGPALFRSGDADAAGVMGRVDLALPGSSRLAPVLSLRTSVLPSYRGSVVGLMGLGVGLRVR